MYAFLNDINRSLTLGIGRITNLGALCTKAVELAELVQSSPRSLAELQLSQGDEQLYRSHLQQTVLYRTA
jgi:hypothetical protein